MKDHRGRIGMRLFVKELDARLAKLGPEDIRELLIRKAGQLPPDDRGELLEMLDAEPPAEEQLPDSQVAEADGQALLEEIDSFVQRVEAGVFCEGYGWDERVGHHRVLGDESWVELADDLLDRAGEAFLRGDRRLAADAYGKLLHAFTSYDSLPGDGADAMLQADLDEVKARYLRCLCELLPADECVRVMLDEIPRLYLLGSEETGLQEALEVDPAPLPQLEALLPVWKEALVSDSDLRLSAWLRMRDGFLVEAVRMSGGIDELREFVQALGSTRPALCFALIRDLLLAGRWEEAADEAARAIESIASAASRAEMADWLAIIARRLGDEAMALEARESAFLAFPDSHRLRLALAELAPSPSALAGLATRWARAVEAHDERGVDRPRRWLELLSGERVGAIRRLLSSVPNDWGWSPNDAEVVLPFVFLAAIGGRMPPPRTALQAVVRHFSGDREAFALGFGIAETGPADSPQMTLEEAIAQCPHDQGRLANELLRVQAPELWEWMVASLQATPVFANDRILCAKIADTATQVRSAAIAAGKHRAQYGEAAHLIAAMAEVHLLNGDPHFAMQILGQARTDLSRWNALTRTLREVCAASPLLPDEPPKPTVSPTQRKVRVDALIKLGKARKPLEVYVHQE